MFEEGVEGEGCWGRLTRWEGGAGLWDGGVPGGAGEGGMSKGW